MVILIASQVQEYVFTYLYILRNNVQYFTKWPTVNSPHVWVIFTSFLYVGFILVFELLDMRLVYNQGPVVLQVYTLYLEAKVYRCQVQFAEIVVRGWDKTGTILFIQKSGMLTLDQKPQIMHRFNMVLEIYLLFNILITSISSCIHSQRWQL